MGHRETCDTEETGKRGINYIHGRCTWKQGIEELMHGHRDKTMHTQINVHVHVAMLLLYHLDYGITDTSYQ